MAKVTIDDVADLAGVSIKTVSRVVNREPNVRESTREKVSAAVSYTHLTLPTINGECRSRWSPDQ